MQDHLQMIDRHLEAGDLKRAEVAIARLLRVASLHSEDRSRILIQRAKVRLLSERPDDSLEDLRACCALQPSLAEHPDVLELIGDIYFARFELAPVGFADRSDADQALQAYDKLIHDCNEYPNLGWVLYQKGRVLLSENRVDEAVAAFQQALQSSSRVTSLAALCYERLGFVELFERRNPTAALTHFSQAVSVYPVGGNTSWLVQLHILRSRALREQRLYGEALMAARQSLWSLDRTAPDFRRALPEAHLALGEALAHMCGREEEAVDHLVQFLQSSRRPLGVDVTWSRVHETIGDLSFRLARYEQAVESYKNALIFNPYHPLEIALNYQIARSYYRARAYREAIAAVERVQQAAAADEAAVQYYRVFNVLGNAYFALAHYAAAAEAYRHALELAPAGSEDCEKIRAYLELSEELGSHAK